MFPHIHYKVGSKKCLSSFFLNKLIFMTAKSHSCRSEEGGKGEKRRYHFITSTPLITDQLRLDVWRHPVQFHCSNNFLRDAPTWVLTFSSDGSSPTSLHKVPTCLATPTVKKMFSLCLNGISHISICAQWLLPSHWSPLKEAWLCLLYSLPSGIYRHW